jgi:HEAT repeat protein
LFLPATGAVFADGEVGDAQVEAAIRALDDANEGTREIACLTLRRAGRRAESAVPALIQRLRTDDSITVRSGAADALVAIGGASVPGLAEALTTGDEVAGELAADALGDLGPAAKDGVPTLAQVMRSSRSHFVRAGAACALVRVCGGEKSAIDAFAVMTEMLRSPDSRVRVFAARITGSLGPLGKPILPALLHTSKDPDPGVRISSARSVAQIDAAGEAGQMALQLLITSLEAKEETSRKAAAEELEILGPAATKALPMLDRLVKDDPSLEVRHAAEEASAHIRAAHATELWSGAQWALLTVHIRKADLTGIDANKLPKAEGKDFEASQERFLMSVLERPPGVPASSGMTPDRDGGMTLTLVLSRKAIDMWPEDGKPLQDAGLWGSIFVKVPREAFMKFNLLLTGTPDAKGRFQGRATGVLSDSTGFQGAAFEFAALK